MQRWRVIRSRNWKDRRIDILDALDGAWAKDERIETENGEILNGDDRKSVIGKDRVRPK